MAFGLDDEFGFYDAECQGCDILTRVDDVGLCKECAAKLDRDLVRQRDWDYSAWLSAFRRSKDKSSEERSSKSIERLWS